MAPPQQLLLLVLLSLYIGNVKPQNDCGDEACDIPIDLTFVYDGSSSQVGEPFQMQRTFSKAIMDKVTIGPGDMHSRVALAINAGAQNKTDSFMKINWRQSYEDATPDQNPPNPRNYVDSEVDVCDAVTGAGTALEYVLEKVYQEMSSPGSGSRHSIGIRNIVIMITDGVTQSEAMASMYIEKLEKDFGVIFISAISVKIARVGRLAKSKLLDLGVTEDHIVLAIESEGDSLLDLIDIVISKTCGCGKCPTTISLAIDYSRNTESGTAAETTKWKSLLKLILTWITDHPGQTGGIGAGSRMTHVFMHKLGYQGNDNNMNLLGFDGSPAQSQLQVEQIMDNTQSTNQQAKLTTKYMDALKQNEWPPLRLVGMIDQRVSLVHMENEDFINNNFAKVADRKSEGISFIRVDTDFAGLWTNGDLNDNLLNKIEGDEQTFEAAVNATLSDLLLFHCRPVTTPKPAEVDSTTSPPENFCELCWERRGQRPFYANPENCSTYYHCFRNTTGKIEGILRPCPAGSRFSDDAMTCVPMWNGVSCDDPCQDPTIMMEGWWMKPEDCGVFYQCSNYYSIKMCCPPFHSFNMSWGDCMFNESCISHHDECKQTVTVPMWTPQQLPNQTCHDVQYDVVRRVHANPHQYIVILNPFKGVPKELVRDCPPGTLFSLETCKCSNHTDWVVNYPDMDDCLLDIRCDNKTIIDSSKHQFWIDNLGKPKITISDNKCSFLKPGHLEVPGLQGNTMGPSITLNFWVFIQCGSDGGGIFSNRGGKLPGTMDTVEPSLLVINERIDDTDFYRILGGVRTTKENMLNNVGVENLQCGRWYMISMVYYWGQLKMYVNCDLKDTYDTKFDEKAPIFWMLWCPLAIGNDQTFGYYTGLLDEMQLCREGDLELCSIFDEQSSAKFPPLSIGDASTVTAIV